MNRPNLQGKVQSDGCVESIKHAWPCSVGVPTLQNKPVKAMAPLLRVAALVAGLLFASTAMACEKHLQGHQPGSDTDVEAQNR